MAQARTTLSDLSKALNLSVSTISKSLSDGKDVSPLTKRRVKEFAKNCNYLPNTFASNLRKGNTKTIGLLIPNVLNLFYAKALAGIEKYLDGKGYKLIISITYESASKEFKCLEMMASGYVDGIIVCISKETQIKNNYDHFLRIIDQNLPIVLFDRISDAIDCDKVIIDDYQASFNATEYLIKTHHCKKIALVSLINDLPHGRLRYNGFKAALKNNKFEGDNDYIITSNNLVDFKLKITGLLKNKKIEGIFGVNEEATIHTIQIARSLGYHIEGDLSIAAFCNHSQVAYNASLNIVNQHAEKMGIEAAKLVLRRVKNTNVED
jgi:LacI family transcriptional regulator